MSFCINLLNPEYIALREQAAETEDILRAKVIDWQNKNNTDRFPSLKEIGVKDKRDIVQYDLKAINALNSNINKVKSLYKQLGNTDIFWAKIQKDLQIPKNQLELLKESEGNTIEEKIVSFVAAYSYAIEINLAKESTFKQKPSGFREESEDKVQSYTDSEGNTKWQVVNTEIGVIESNFNTKEDALAFIGADVTGQKPTSYYSNLTVPGGTNYTEQEIATPAITPSIKGHAQFSTDKGIGWFRSDEQRIDDNKGKKVPDGAGGLVQLGVVTDSKTRRILEVQSDLFQKGRDKKSLTDSEKEPGLFFKTKSGQIVKVDSQEEFDKYFQSGELDGTEEPIVKDVDVKNEFLQLLNKDSNWVTFFIKSIVQDSAKKGYEKILFPTGNTASKVEGHSTLEEFKKSKEDRIKKLQEERNIETLYKVGDYYNRDVNKYSKEKQIGYNKVEKYELEEINKQVLEKQKSLDNEITQLKQELERVEGPEGFAALKPIYNFYENTVTNILNKTYGKENVKVITDEYGNTWNEVEIKEERDLEKVFLRKASLAKPDYKKGDVDKAIKFLQEKLNMTTDEVSKVIGLIDNNIFGKMTTDGRILLSDLMEVGSEYHEAFHRVWNFYITPEERLTVLEEFKKDPKYKEKIEYIATEYPELSEDDIIEEYFGEDFRDFMMAETEPKTKLETLYSRIINFLRSLVGIKAKDAKELYKMISQGRFAKAKKLSETTAVDKNRKLALAKEPLSAMEKKELLTNMDYYFSAALFSTDSIISTDIKSIYDFTDGSYSKEDVNKLYNVVLKRLKEELYASDSPRANEIAKLFDSDEAEVIKTLKVEHLRRLSSFNIKLKYDAIDDSNDSVGEQQPDSKEEKAEQGRDSLGITPAFEFNTKDGMPKVVKLLISAIPQTDNEGNAVMSKALGITQAGSWNNNVNILKNNLATIPADIDNFMKKLAEVAETNSQFQYLLENLGYYEGNTSAEFMENIPLNPETEFLYNLRRDFVSEFALTKYNFYIGLLREDGVFRFKSANSEHVSDAIRTNMANNFQRAYSEFIPDNKKNKQAEFISLLSSPGVKLEEKLEALGIEINESVTQEAYTNVVKEVKDLITIIARLSKDDFFKIENIFAKAKTNTQSKTSVSGRIDKIVSLLAKSSNENNELQFFNIEGKPVYLINQNTYQTIVIDAINYYLDEAEKSRTNEDSLEMVEIRKKLLQENIPHLFSSQAPNSVWINRILDGNKLEYGIIEGIKNEEDATGTHSSELKEPDLMSLNVNLTLSGFSVSMKHSDRSVYPIYKLGTDSSVLSETTNPIKDAIPIIQGYLTDEINKPKDNPYSYMGITKDNYLKKSFFGEMLSYELFQSLIKGDATVNNPKVVAGIKEYLSKLVKTNKDQFQEYQLDKSYKNRGKSIDRKSIGIPNEILVKFNNSWENAVEYAAVETLLQNYEQAILFVGDITAYKESKDLSKRLNTQSSTGRLSLIGEEVDYYVKTKNEESKFTIDRKEYTYKEKEDVGTIRELVIKDPSVKAYFYDGIRKAIYDKLIEDFKGNEELANKYADNYASAYEGYTENDGFSYVNMFMAREFELRSSEWSDAKQRNFDLQIKFLNSGYNFDSIKEDLEIPEGVDLQDWLFSTYSPLSIKKPQYVGPNDFSKEGDLNIVGGRKTAYMPLVPTEIHDVALNAVHEFMLVNSIDVLHMQGAAKFGVKEMRPLYTEGKWDIQKIAEDQVGRLPWKFMKNQVKIANEPKGEITSSTQSRKNILEGFFNKGLPSDYKGSKEEWDSFSEEAKRLESNVYDLVRTYEITQNQIIERSHKALLKELTAVEYSDSVSYASLDNLRKIIVEAAIGRNSPDNVIEAAENFLKEVKYIELLPNSDRIQPILNSLVTNRILVQKRLGDMVPQAAVTGFETSPRTYDKDGKMESAKDSLKFYEVNEDGSISPAEIMIPITPDLLEIAFKKYNTRNVITALNAINKDITDGNVEIIAKGLRIPNQQYSSNDVFKIKKFFSPLVQGMAVVPSELVAKTGGDFDIDKISVYYFHLDENGDKIKLNLDKDAKQSLKALENHLLETEIKMLLHPSQAKNLFSPVADSPLASSKEKHLTKEDKAGTAMTKLFSLGYNVSASIRFVSGKAGVGQMATWINFTDLAQRHGLKLNSDYPGIIIPIEGLENDLELGKNIDNSGESISIVLSALLTSQVDLVSNPYAEALNIINQTLDTVAYMVVRGVPANIIIDIIKSPVVSEFLKAERINQSEVIKSTGSYNENYNPEGLKKSNDALVEEFMQIGDYKKGLPTIDEISKNDSRISGNLFDMFIQFRQQAKEINKVKRYYSPDTKYLKDRNGVNQLNQLYAEINTVNDEVVPIITEEEQDKLITNNSLLEGFHKGRMLYDKLYNQFFFLDKLKSYQGFKRVISKISYLSTDEANKLFNSMDQNFITYLLQNYSSILEEYGYTFDKLLKGKDSVANKYVKYKNSSVFEDNFFVKNIMPLVNYRQTGINNFRLYKGKMTTSDANEQIESFEELADLDPSLAAETILANLFQSGTYNSSFQLNKAIPYDYQEELLTDLNPIIKEILADAEIKDDVINEFMHKFLLSHTEYIPEMWRIMGNEKLAIMPYGKYEDGSIGIISKNKKGSGRATPIGNYQGIDYTTDVPLTTNFKVGTEKEVVETESVTKKVSESEEITNFAKTLDKEQMARIIEKFGTNDLVKIFEEHPFVIDVKDFIDEINCL